MRLAQALLVLLASCVHQQRGAEEMAACQRSCEAARVCNIENARRGCSSDVRFRHVGDQLSAAQANRGYDPASARLAMAEEERLCFAQMLAEVDARYSACVADNK